VGLGESDEVEQFDGVSRRSRDQPSACSGSAIAPSTVNQGVEALKRVLEHHPHVRQDFGRPAAYCTDRLHLEANMACRRFIETDE
jgi:hypothetical protein